MEIIPCVRYKNIEQNKSVSIDALMDIDIEEGSSKEKRLDRN